jgi:hypothetical protein
MIHYHGLPITPETAAASAIEAGHAFVSFSDARQLGLAASVCQSFALDNGAFGAWRAGKPVSDWSEFYRWARECQRIPSCDFAVIPDVIDGDEKANDDLLAEWPLPRWFGAPVWHLHESLARLQVLVKDWPRVCLGSSGEYAQIKTPQWWRRMAQAMHVACDEDGRPFARLHGLRMLDPEVFTRFPFASVDSTNIGRNVGIDQAWRGTYQPATKEARAAVMRGRIESHNAPARWDHMPYEPEQVQQGLLL